MTSQMVGKNNFLNVEKQVWPDTVMNYECAPTRD